MFLFVAPPPAGVKGKCRRQDGSGRDADCSGDSTVSTRQSRQSGFFQSGTSIQFLSVQSLLLRVCSAFTWAVLSLHTLFNCPVIQASAPRSTTVILVKNLPAGVTAAELEELFSPHGSLGRVVLPPSGLTAIVEFMESTEAKRAFKRLAYSKVRGSLHQQLLYFLLSLYAQTTKTQQGCFDSFLLFNAKGVRSNPAGQ